MSRQARLATSPLPLRRKGQVLAKTTDADPQTTPGNAPINPSSECTDQAVTANVTTSLDATNPNPEASGDESYLPDISGDESRPSDAPDDKLQLSSVPDIGMDDSKRVITINDGDALAVTAPPTQSGVKIKFLPLLGVHALVESESPTLLSVNKDVRPDWLLTVVREHLPNVPYLGCLGKVVDLFLAQEARLGYPNVVSVFVF